MGESPSSCTVHGPEQSGGAGGRNGRQEATSRSGRFCPPRPPPYSPQGHSLSSFLVEVPRSQPRSSLQAESSSPGPLNPIKPPASPPGALSPPQQTFPEPLLYVQCYARYWEHTCPDLAPVLEVLQMLGATHGDSTGCDGAGETDRVIPAWGEPGVLSGGCRNRDERKEPDFKTRRG